MNGLFGNASNAFNNFHRATSYGPSENQLKGSFSLSENNRDSSKVAISPSIPPMQCGNNYFENNFQRKLFFIDSLLFKILKKFSLLVSFPSNNQHLDSLLSNDHLAKYCDLNFDDANTACSYRNKSSQGNDEQDNEKLIVNSNDGMESNM